MKATISIIWLIFTVLFFCLGWQHYSASKQVVPPFPTPEYKGLNKRGSIRILGQDLDRPIKDFAKNFNAYLAEQNEANRGANQRSAWGYFLAAPTAFVSMLLEWRESISSRFKNKKHRPTEAVQQSVGEPTSDSAPSEETNAAQR
jgi:hypothetical protein